VNWPKYFTKQLYAALKLVDLGVLSPSTRGTMHGKSYLRSARLVLGRPHLDAAEGVGGLGEILVEADEGFTAFRLGQMQTIRKVHALPHPGQRLRRGGKLGSTLPGLHYFIYGIVVIGVILVTPRGLLPLFEGLWRRWREAR
jgi:hypothetical protein